MLTRYCARNSGQSAAEVRIAQARERFKKSKHAARHGGSENNLTGNEGVLDNPVIRALWEVVDQLDAHRVDYALMGGLDRVAEMPLVKLKTMLDQDHWVDLDIFLCETDFQRSLMDRRLKTEFDDSRSLWIVTPEDLVLLKLIANRPRDLIDVADVLFVQGQLDETYLRHWANVLTIQDQLTKTLATSN